MIPIGGRQQVNIMSWINKYFHRLVKLNDSPMGTETAYTLRTGSNIRQILCLIKSSPDGDGNFCFIYPPYGLFQ